MGVWDHNLPYPVTLRHSGACYDAGGIPLFWSKNFLDPTSSERNNTRTNTDAKTGVVVLVCLGHGFLHRIYTFRRLGIEELQRKKKKWQCSLCRSLCRPKKHTHTCLRLQRENLTRKLTTTGIGHDWVCDDDKIGARMTTMRKTRAGGRAQAAWPCSYCCRALTLATGRRLKVSR